MKTIKCENCGKETFYIISYDVIVGNKIYTVCGKCKKILEKFNEEHMLTNNKN